mmetsp:Transcript_25060/g.79664  ORF Transcript_25060/g.79664 Transcript_25060/m.79664 type:complete len:336 (+) Transcript_25060:977-1984(+)
MRQGGDHQGPPADVPPQGQPLPGRRQELHAQVPTVRLLLRVRGQRRRGRPGERGGSHGALRGGERGRLLRGPHALDVGVHLRLGGDRQGAVRHGGPRRPVCHDPPVRRAARTPRGAAAAARRRAAGPRGHRQGQPQGEHRGPRPRRQGRARGGLPDAPGGEGLAAHRAQGQRPDAPAHGRRLWARRRLRGPAQRGRGSERLRRARPHAPHAGGAEARSLRQLCGQGSLRAPPAPGAGGPGPHGVLRPPAHRRGAGGRARGLCRGVWAVRGERSVGQSGGDVQNRRGGGGGRGGAVPLRGFKVCLLPPRHIDVLPVAMVCGRCGSHAAQSRKPLSA